LKNRFALPDRQEDADMAAVARFRVLALYSDYDEGPFDAESSPFMLLILGA
jgi:hypothetical protein